MITIQKAGIIEDEKVREAVFAVIEEREMYYINLFGTGPDAPDITVKFENLQPFRLRITFKPRGKAPVHIDIEGFTTPEIVTKHAFKKLRRVAKNHFTKQKKLRSHR